MPWLPCPTHMATIARNSCSVGSRREKYGLFRRGRFVWNRPGGPLTDHRSEELTRFSHSPEYAEYRQRLGLAPPQ